MTLVHARQALVVAYLARACSLPVELSEDDECASGEGDCAWHALQLRASRGATEINTADKEEGLDLHVHNSSSHAGGCLSRKFQPWRSGKKELCFSQLAGNKGSLDTKCACPQGCNGIAWENTSTVTFANKAEAKNCKGNQNQTVLLTAPRGFWKDLHDLKTHWSCAVEVIELLLKDSWTQYQNNVATGPVYQCFHGSRIASVKYLHLQTFSQDCKFHGMPTSNHHVAMCTKMSAESDAGQLAKKLANMIPR